MYCLFDDDVFVMVVCRILFLCDIGDLDVGCDVLIVFFFDFLIFWIGIGICEIVCDFLNGILDYDLCIWGDNVVNVLCFVDVFELVMECFGFILDWVLCWIDFVCF